MEDVFSYGDELGPAKGPSIGGIRMTGDVSTEECSRLARVMTFKNAAGGLPHGGGENIYPREIEDFLFSHPKFAEVAVFGVPDKFYGERGGLLDRAAQR
jgi:hypothetical protein